MDLSVFFEHTIDFLTLFIPGYIFFIVFNYLNNYQRENSKEHLIIKCIVVSYILFACWEAFIYKLFVNDYKDIGTVNTSLILLCISIILAVLLGLLSKLSIIDGIISTFSRTRSDDIWKDINIKSQKFDYVIAIVRLKGEPFTYHGQLEFVESHQREPVIALVYYCTYDDNGNLLKDYSNMERNLVFKFSQVEKIELEYLQKRISK